MIGIASEVEFLMENCEVLTFKADEIDYLELNGINKSFMNVGGKLELTTKVYEFLVEFNAKANRDYSNIFEDEPHNTYDRLSCQDLVAIILKNKHEGQWQYEHYYIKWEDELDSYQDDPAQFLIKNEYGQALFGNHRETQEDLINDFNFIGGIEC